MSERVKVAYINEPKPGRKTGSIKTDDGRFFDVWPDKLAMFKQGGEYEIETTSRDYNGKTYFTATSAKPVNGNGHAPAAGPAVRFASYSAKSPETQARIERQHSQEMALRYFAIRGLPEGDMAPVRAMVDWFQRDVAHTFVLKPLPSIAPEAGFAVTDDEPTGEPTKLLDL